MNLQPYKIPILKTFKNGKAKLIGVKKIKWFTSPHVTVPVVKQGDYQDIEYTIFNPGSRSHIEKWLAEDLSFEFPYYTTKGKVKVDPESLDSMEHPSGKLLRRYLKLTKDQSQLGGAEGSLIKNYDAITQTVKSRVDTNGTLCLTDDVIFETDLGPRPLYTLKVGMQVLTSEGTYKTITDIFENGIKPITKVSTAKGLTLTTTPNHPYLVQDKWVNAEDLYIGDALTTVHSIEEWLPIKGWPLYSISSWGRVKNVITGKMLKPTKKKDSKVCYGHLKVTLRQPNGTRPKGTMKDLYIHRLVASAFLKGSGEVRHLNGIPWFNHVDNLAYGTSQQNTQDSIKHGTASKRLLSQAKLSSNTVNKIHSSELNNTHLAKELGVSRELVRDVRLGKRWLPESAKVTKQVSFTSDTICKIETLPERMTYGVTVEDIHTHVTNGIVTHNTGRFTSSAINLAQIPAQKEFRELFRAPVFYDIPDELYAKVCNEIDCKD